MKKTREEVPAAIPANPGSKLLSATRGPLRSYLESAIALIAQAGDDEDSLWKISERGEQMEMAGRLISGLANRELATRVGSQKLAEELRARGKTRANFDFYIRAAEAFEALPDLKSVEAFAELGYTKARAALSWSPEERIAFAHGEPVRGLTIEEAVALPSREFEKRTKPVPDDLAKAKAEAATLKTQLETARMERDRAVKSAKYLLAEEDMPHFALTARQEAMALTEGMSFSLDLLDDVTHQTIFKPVEHPEANRFQPIVAATMYYALGGVLARIQAHMARLSAHFEADDAEMHSALGFSTGELKLFNDTRERIVGRLQADSKKRDAKRENDRPGKVGRKRNEG